MRMRMLTGNAVMAMHSPMKSVRFASSPSIDAGTHAQHQRDEEPHYGDPDVAPCEGVDELTKLDLHPREQHQHEDADIGDGVELR